MVRVSEDTRQLEGRWAGSRVVGGLDWDDVWTGSGPVGTWAPRFSPPCFTRASHFPPLCFLDRPSTRPIPAQCAIFVPPAPLTAPLTAPHARPLPQNGSRPGSGRGPSLRAPGAPRDGRGYPAAPPALGFGRKPAEVLGNGASATGCRMTRRSGARGGRGRRARPCFGGP